MTEVRGAGYRKDGDINDEIRARIKAVGPSLATKTLTEALDLFDRSALGLKVTAEPADPDPAPKWLIESLIRVVNLAPDIVAAMTADEARQAWDDYITTPER